MLSHALPYAILVDTAGIRGKPILELCSAFRVHRQNNRNRRSHCPYLHISFASFAGIADTCA
jgi:hypothetical protein